MNQIVYDKNLTKEQLFKFNIVVDDDACVENGVVLGFGTCVLGKSVVECGCEIGCNSVVENSKLGKNVKVISSYVVNSLVRENSTVGPFANIKNGSQVGCGCRIGNFVEIKNSIIGEKTKIAHLTYVGDAEIGKNCNLGCGVVFCNYNGAIKQKTLVGDNVFVGSNVNLIAPVKIGNGAYIAAGSTINKDVDCEQFAIARSFQTNKENFKNPYKIKKIN